MDSIVTLVALLILAAILVCLIVLLRRNQPEHINNDQLFKDEVKLL